MLIGVPWLRSQSVVVVGDNNMITLKGKYTTAKVMIDQIDEATTGQIIQMINHPAFTNPVAIMSDTHYGSGAVIGFTMPMTDKIIPNIVGHDVSCGMRMILFDKKIKINKEHLDKRIRSFVPFGYEVNDKPAYNMERVFPWNNASSLNIKFCNAFNKKFGTKMEPTFYDYRWFEKKCKQVGMDTKRAVNSIGTLGGGK
jgi:RNA-splicing ligase RtcB